SILEGRNLDSKVWDMLDVSVENAVETYLNERYAKRCIANWAKQNLQFEVRDDQVKSVGVDDLDDVQHRLREMAKEEATSIIANTLGEYVDSEMEADEWDLKGMVSWAMSRFGVSLSVTQLRKMTPDEMSKMLEAAAMERIDEIDMSGLAVYLEENFCRKSLAQWANEKFLINVTDEELNTDPDAVVQLLMKKVQAAYKRREIGYPVEYALEMTVGQAGTDNIYALNALAAWANRKYDLTLEGEQFRSMKVEDICSMLIGHSQEWLGGDKLRQCVDNAMGTAPSAEAAIEFAKTRFDTDLTAEDFKDKNVKEVLMAAGKKFLRREMSELERFVLLQIYDGAWKDHLLAMDHLKSSIGLRGFAEQDPKVAYKREGSRMFMEMAEGVREKVTDMIFKVRLTAGTQMSSVYQISNMVHEQLSGYDHLTQDMANQQQAADAQKVKQIVNETPRVGRNDPCPCGSGKKYKQCHGK
ncbi:MAG: hypothetical protein EHM48_09085, partial [Planctomycetaceae bacterium]